LGADGSAKAVDELSKDDVADMIWDEAVALLDRQVGDGETA
jgi:phosphopantothenoylcysteine decarboxylase/phosphopantothenate--cysteine ligase